MSIGQDLSAQKLPDKATVKGVGHAIKLGTNVSFDKSALWTIEGDGHALEIDDNVMMRRTRIIIRGQNCTVKIAKGVRLKQGTISVAGNGSTLMIGAGTSWESGQIIVEGGTAITIGEDCMFSHDIMIRTSDGHGIFDATSRKLVNPPKSVVIGDHVWIGNGARVNKGSILGSGMVLAGTAVLSGKAAPRSVFAGIPARSIRRNINWSRTFEYDGIPSRYAVQDSVEGSVAQPPSLVTRWLGRIRRKASVLRNTKTSAS